MIIVQCNLPYFLTISPSAPCYILFLKHHYEQLLLRYSKLSCKYVVREIPILMIQPTQTHFYTSDIDLDTYMYANKNYVMIYLTMESSKHFAGSCVKVHSYFQAFLIYLKFCALLFLISPNLPLFPCVDFFLSP